MTDNTDTRIEELIPPTPRLAEVEFAAPRKEDGMWLSAHYSPYFMRGNFNFVNKGRIGIRGDAVTLQGQRSASCLQAFMLIGTLVLFIFLLVFTLLVLSIKPFIVTILILLMSVGLLWLNHKMSIGVLRLPKSGISEVDFDGRCTVQFLAKPLRGRAQRCRFTARTQAEAAFIIYHLSAVWPEEMKAEKPAG